MDKQVKRFRRFYRISLFRFLLLITVLAIAIGYPLARARRQAHIVAEIEQLGGTVFYDYHYFTFSDGEIGVSLGAAPDDNLIVRWLGRDCWHSVKTIEGYRQHFPNNEYTDAQGRKVFTTFGPYKLDTEFQTETDRCLESLIGIGSLDTLDLSDTSVTAEGLETVTRLTSVRKLLLNTIGVGDEALPVIARIRGLENLSIWSLRFSKEALHDLQQQRPNLKIWHPLTTEKQDGEWRYHPVRLDEQDES